MTETNAYYNAKPSKVTNIGLDVSGAKRMHFDTYETDAEKEARKRFNTGLTDIKKAIKSEVLCTNPDRIKLIDLLNKQFELIYGFSGLLPNVRAIISEKRQEALKEGKTSEFNKMIRAYNTLSRDMYRLNNEYSFKYYIQKMKSRYEPKDSFTEESGAIFNWKEFECNEDISGKVSYLKDNARAVQFGNSVSDKERGYILIELTSFLENWKLNPILSCIDLSPVSWSFGARGKAGSVAYYQHGQRLISVNRNNIGSLIHELGHYIDGTKGNVSYEISNRTVNEYRDRIKEGLSRNQLSYYCKREEIFARAFEAYCYKVASFKPFAQTGKSFLPELNDDLISVLKEALS